MFEKFLYFSGNHDDDDDDDDDDDKIDTLTPKDFRFLSVRIESNWKRFARQLLIEEYKIDDIADKKDRGQDRCFKVFNELMKREGSVDEKPIKMALKEIKLDMVISEFILGKKAY